MLEIQHVSQIESECYFECRVGYLSLHVNHIRVEKKSYSQRKTTIWGWWSVGMVILTTLPQVSNE